MDSMYFLNLYTGIALGLAIGGILGYLIINYDIKQLVMEFLKDRYR